ncbi:hypothetical protein PFISCL1PPCAC_1641, partial [Pristionchus fissidentatus]
LILSMNLPPVLIDLTNEDEQPLKKKKPDEPQKLVKYPTQVKITPYSSTIPEGSDGVLITSYCTRKPTSNLFLTPSSSCTTPAPRISGGANHAPALYDRISPPVDAISMPNHYEGATPSPNSYTGTSSAPNFGNSTRPSSVGPFPTSWNLGSQKTPVGNQVYGEMFTTNTKFCDVTSHINLARGRKIQVSVGEIFRRLGAPEYQDKEMIARLTKHAKTSKLSFDRIFAMFNIDLKINEGIERQETVIESLLEADALQLAKDFTKITSSELWLSVVAAIVVDSVGERMPEFKRCFEQIKTHLIRVKQHILCAGREPSDMVRHKEHIQTPEAHSVCIFSLATHGFGPLAVSGVIEFVMQIIDYLGRRILPMEEIENVNVVLPHLGNSDGSLNNSDATGSHPSNSSNSPTAKTKNGYFNSNEMDLCLLTPISMDYDVFDDSVLPRIAYNRNNMQVLFGEIRRRVLGPEKFNISLVGAYVRKGKKSSTLPSLHAVLEEKGMKIPERARKGLEPSSWTSLTEKEAMNLAEETAFHLSKVTMKAMEKNDAVMWTIHIAETLDIAMSRIGVSPSHPKAETNADLHILRYAMITHHFGHSFFASVMEWIMKVI